MSNTRCPNDLYYIVQIKMIFCPNKINKTPSRQNFCFGVELHIYMLHNKLNVILVQIKLPNDHLSQPEKTFLKYLVFVY